MRIKYNRVSTLGQTGNRFEADKDKYDLILLDKISGTVNFKDRPKSKELIKLVEEGKVTEIVVEELSRLGRNTGDVIRTLEWLDEKEINVVVRNMGLQSLPNGIKNPVWKMISTIMSSLYQNELESIRHRCMTGRMIARQRNVIFGRPVGTNESDATFINKPNNKKILEYLKKKRTVREISKILSVSTSTVMKVKKVAAKLKMI